MIPLQTTEIQCAAELLRKARHAIVFTGAGISTHSGIPDFRSANTGLWQRDDPMEVGSLTAFQRRPERFFNWLRPLAQKIWQAHPNAAHLALAEMEGVEVIRGVITQNIDGLHQQAGSKSVIELHGTLATLSCLKCRKRFNSEEFRTAYVDYGEIPHCPACQSILKPDIVLFEEMLPVQAWAQAEQMCQQADVMLVIGSSLEVTPAAFLPEMAVDLGAALIIITFSPTHLDSQANVVFHEDLIEVVPALWAEVQRQGT